MTQPAHRTICTLGLAVSDRETHGSVRDDATDSVSLDVSQHVVERALRYVLEGAGARFVDEPEAITISDSVRDRPSVLVVDPTPVSCRAAVDAAHRGEVDAVLPCDRPDDVLAALFAVRSGFVALHRTVVDASSRLPDVQPRELEILTSVMTGRSNRQIARSLNVSEATVKRDIATLIDRLGAADRGGLAAIAFDMGLQPEVARQ